jgi:hypothetical protein
LNKQRVYIDIYEKLHDLYSSPNVILVMKSERMRWAGNVVGMSRRGACSVRVGNTKESDHLEDLGVDWILKKFDGTAMSGFI